MFDNIMSKNNIVYVRFFAEKRAINGSKFSDTFTAMRELDTNNKLDVCKDAKHGYKNVSTNI